MYRHDNRPLLDLHGNVASVDWSKSFSVNSELKQFVLFINSSAVYIGPSTTYTFTVSTTHHTGTTYSVTLVTSVVFYVLTLCCLADFRDVSA